MHEAWSHQKLFFCKKCHVAFVAHLCLSNSTFHLSCSAFNICKTLGSFYYAKKKTWPSWVDCFFVYLFGIYNIGLLQGFSSSEVSKRASLKPTIWGGCITLSIKTHKYTYSFRPLAFYAPFADSFCQQLAINSNNSEFNINYQSA